MENHKYEEVYTYRLLETIKNGKTVYLLDKAEHTVCAANAITAERLAVLLDETDYKNSNRDRYFLWTVNEEENNEQIIRD